MSASYGICELLSENELMTTEFLSDVPARDNCYDVSMLSATMLVDLSWLLRSESTFGIHSD